jgi:3-hydroxyisobutyrate dehydrogenase-like beta-hydroxyacid dehydrogenase
MPDTALGFLGLGVMGGPMARNLVRAGYPVIGFDTDAGGSRTRSRRGREVCG